MAANVFAHCLLKIAFTILCAVHQFKAGTFNKHYGLKSTVLVLFPNKLYIYFLMYFHKLNTNILLLLF